MMEKKWIAVVTFVAWSSVAWGIQSRAYLDSQQEITGTEARRELEFKQAYWLDAATKPKAIVGDIARHLRSLKKAKHRLPQMIKQRYLIDASFSSFVFRDHYLDTANFLLFNRRSAYRLRYRWNKLSRFVRHQLFPFLRAFYPTRCEVQFKDGYRASADRTMSAMETRFEFRNESEPFVYEQDAPPPPWPLKKYLGHAETGRFRSYRMLPTYNLVKRFAKTHPSIVLRPVLTATTIRYRSHVNISANPWGWGPNPQQVFIVTLDVTSFKRDGEAFGKKSLELEIEIDRNISTMLDAISGNESQDPVIRDAASVSRLAKQAVLTDHKHLREALSAILGSHIKSRPLPVDYKYHRIVKIWWNKRS